MRLSETANKVISLAESVRHYWDTELPRRHPNYPLVNVDEDSGPPPPEEKELMDLLASLPEDDVYELALIMYLGRGDFAADDLSGQYEALKRTFGNPEWTASQMVEKAPLAEYLRDGLAELEKAGIDVDHLALSPVSSGS